MKKYSIGLYEKAMPGELSWRQRMETARRLGYDYFEISIDEKDEKLARLDWTETQISELTDLMQELSMPIRSMCLSGHRRFPLGSEDFKIRERGMEIMEKAIDLADRLGIRTIQLAGYDVYYEESTAGTVQTFTDNLKRAAEMAAVKGIQLGFETMETSFMDTAKKAMKFVDMIGSAYLGVYPDIGNMTNAAVLYGTDVIADLESAKGHLLAMHLKETVPGRYREVPFGMGHVDFEAAISKAWELGIRRFVTEMWYVGQEDWEGDIENAVTMMKEILDRQGD